MWTPDSSICSLPLEHLIDSHPSIVPPETLVWNVIGHLNLAPDQSGSLHRPSQSIVASPHSLETDYVLVVERNQLLGIVTAETVGCCTQQGLNLQQVTVADIMTRVVTTLNLAQMADEATVLTLLRQNSLGYLPILNTAGEVMGVLNRGRLVNLEPEMAEPTLASADAILPELQQVVAAQAAELKTLRAALQQETARREQIEKLLNENAQLDQLVNDIAQDICRSLNLEDILNRTVDRVRQLLKADRVCVYRLPKNSGIHHENHCGSVVVEARVPDCSSMLEFLLCDSVLGQATYVQHSQQGQPLTIADTHQAGLDPSLVELLSFFQIRAKLVVPILQVGEERLSWEGGSLSAVPGIDSDSSQALPHVWGWLAVHQQVPRQWQPQEVHLLKRLTDQVSIAIRQAELYQQVQGLNAGLEAQVEERTAQFQQALSLEATLMRVTDKVRDSLDESQILQTAVKELVHVLNIDRCTVSLYNLIVGTCTVCYEYSKVPPLLQGKTVMIDEVSAFCQRLAQGEYFQFCAFTPYLNRSQEAVLVCSIFGNQEVLGELRLYARRGHGFNELEIWLAQQVANQCAIAIRQARLYQSAQAQVRELEALNHLKDDFLSTVSHELRTPLSSIKVAAQMLELALSRSSSQGTESSVMIHADAYQKIERYLKILRIECDREINLINNVLTLQQLEAGNQPLLPTPIRLQDWLPTVVEVFEEQTRNHQQQLKVQVPARLPTLVTDLFMLDQILEELLTNACKFTPLGETIAVSAQMKSQKIWLKVKTTGVEIASSEWTRIFDKFYRIPSADPWKQGGTGLGLALVKRLSERLGGRVWVESAAAKTCFTVELPLTLERETPRSRVS